MSMPTLSVEGKVALVTGAAGERGLGRAIALAFAEAGADVAVCDKEVELRDRCHHCRRRGLDGISTPGWADAYFGNADISTIFLGSLRCALADSGKGCRYCAFPLIPASKDGSPILHPLAAISSTDAMRSLSFPFQSENSSRAPGTPTDPIFTCIAEGLEDPFLCTMPIITGL